MRVGPGSRAGCPLVDLGLDHDPKTTESVATLLENAAAEFRRLNMPGPSRTAAELAAQIQLAHSKPKSSLTTREQEVADLLVEGLANRTIAQRLFLSERAFETHVPNILAKLHLCSRTEIAVWNLRH